MSRWQRRGFVLCMDAIIRLLFGQGIVHGHPTTRQAQARALCTPRAGFVARRGGRNGIILI
jgi:hypothetical protein